MSIWSVNTSFRRKEGFQGESVTQMPHSKLLVGYFSQIKTTQVVLHFTKST